MNSIKATYHLTAGQVREICIRNNWYTRGNCEQYDCMLRVCRHNNDHGKWNLDLLAETARNIINHSDPERFRNLDGIGRDPALEYVLYELGNAGAWTFET